MTEDEMAGWPHGLSGHEFEQAPGNSEAQGSLACCSPWGCKESDTTERLNSKLRIGSPRVTAGKETPTTSLCVPSCPWDGGRRGIRVPGARPRPDPDLSAELPASWLETRLHFDASRTGQEQVLVSCAHW